MTPREFSAGVVTAKLEHIRGLLEALDQMGDLDGARLRGDVVLRLAVERVLTQLVELAASANGHISASLGKTIAAGTYRESFDLAAAVGAISAELAARLKPSAGLRNILVHNYTTTDWNIVVASVPQFRSDYGDYVREVATWLSMTGEGDPPEGPPSEAP
ncbi:MAG TPA: DUF86 domain-containing protein [Arachnia sp.]|nr:DUF86 domain-containing protein [Arachnia sp.]